MASFDIERRSLADALDRVNGKQEGPISRQPARRERPMPNALAHVADFFIATWLRWI
jgi:hypothetical protein